MDTISFLNDIWHNAIVRVLVTIIVLALVNLVSHRLIQTIIRHAVRPSRHHVTRDDEVKRENTLIHIFRTAITVIIAIVGVVIILGEIGINVAALATGAGLVGVLVGFGAQNAIRDYLAGIFIIIENQYRVGDIVAVSGGTIGAGKSGVVEDVTIRITKLRDLDGVLHIIRNGEPSIISNLSINFANVNVDLSVAYNADVDAAATIINRVGIEQAGDEAWRHDIIEPIHFFAHRPVCRFSHGFKVFRQSTAGSPMGYCW